MKASLLILFAALSSLASAKVLTIDVRDPATGRLTQTFNVPIEAKPTSAVFPTENQPGQKAPKSRAELTVGTWITVIPVDTTSVKVSMERRATVPQKAGKFVKVVTDGLTEEIPAFGKVTFSIGEKATRTGPDEALKQIKKNAPAEMPAGMLKRKTSAEPAKAAK